MPSVLHLNSICIYEQDGPPFSFHEHLSTLNNISKRDAVIHSLPICDILLGNNHRTTTLLDTGAASNFIANSLVNKLHLKTFQLPLPIAAKGAWGEPTNITLCCSINFALNGQRFNTVALVIPAQLTTNVILGCPFLVNNPKLLPIILEKLKQTRNKPISVAKKFSNIKRALKNPENQAYLCWISQSDEQATPVPNFIKEQFQDVIVDALPPHDSYTTTI